MSSSDESTFGLRIILPSGVAWEGQAKHLRVPLKTGSIGILPGHAPMTASLGAGKILITEADSKEPKGFAIKEGLLNVHGNRATLLTNELGSPATPKPPDQQTVLRP